MAISEFRYNRKRKHYAYIYGKKGDLRKNLLLSFSPTRKVKKRNGTKKVVKNVKLQRNPNPLVNEPTYVMTKRCTDHKDKFGEKVFTDWSFSPDDRRVIKRLKKGKRP